MNSNFKSFVKMPAQLSIIGGQKKRKLVFANEVINPFVLKDNQTVLLYVSNGQNYKSKNGFLFWDLQSNISNCHE
jgi:hypothetical protein